LLLCEGDAKNPGVSNESEAVVALTPKVGDAGDREGEQGFQFREQRGLPLQAARPFGVVGEAEYPALIDPVGEAKIAFAFEECVFDMESWNASLDLLGNSKAYVQPPPYRGMRAPFTTRASSEQR
jgi:hypothetical protein